MFIIVNLNRKDVEAYFYHGGKEPQDGKLPPKPMLVMTKKTTKEDILTIPLYKCKAFHHLVESTAALTKEVEADEKFKEFEKYLLLFPFNEDWRQYHVSIVEDKIVDFKDALDYLLKKRNYESVLVEAGTTLIGPYLEDPNIESPFDLIVLSVFSGKVFFLELSSFKVSDWKRMGRKSLP